MRRLASILLWSVLAAAFIGPGTVTTAAAAGAGHGTALLWALGFSVVACLVLQEAAGRLTIVSGRDLAAALGEGAGAGWRRAAVLALVLGGVVLGCAAYEAGNILGGVAGAALALPFARPVLTLATGAVAAALLWLNSPRGVARLLSLLVAVMGVAFVGAAVSLDPDWGEIAAAAVTPRLPTGGGVLALGLLGTTVVPYNLFLGSGLARGERLGEMRLGLGVAIGAGGLISMAVLVVGAALDGPFSFDALAGLMAARLGGWARTLFAAGLFAAGLSSAVTAPLAAALTARGLFGRDAGDERWGDRGWRFRAVWAGVLAVGLGFGLSGVRPVPAIVLAQALNGVLLPAAAIFLLLAVNDRRLMAGAVNGPLSNAAAALVTAVAMVLGTAGVLAAGARVAGLSAPTPGTVAAVAGALVLALAVPLARALRRRRAG